MVASRQSPPYIQTLADADRHAHAEQRLFILSPLNLWLTAALLYAIVIAAYAFAAALDGAPWIVREAGGYALDPSARIALVLTLVACVALAMQRYTHLRDYAEAQDLARVLRPEVVAGLTAFPSRNLGLATALGAVAGVGVVVAFSMRSTLMGLDTGMPRFLWFSAMTIFTSIMFVRGVELSRTGAKGTREVIDKALVVDLLQVDRLHAWGRLAARNSLTWFAVSAAACLLFVSRASALVTLTLLGACLVMGLSVFVATMERIHQRIRAAKATELESVRTEISSLKARLTAHSEVADKLHSLLAYEARIAAVREWPVDQTILVRVFGSALILAIPWFGQAVAGVLVEHLGQLAR
jgi:hypothetical protein